MSQDNNPLIHITPHDLPLHCSGPQREAWSGHPRVFLPIQSNSDMECPYCGSIYHLDGEANSHH